MNLTYAVKRFFRLDFGRAFRQLKKTAKKSGKSTVYILFDMLYCAVKYGAGPNDYELFEFYNISADKRKTFITRAVNNSLVKRFNDKAYWKYFDDKNLFNETFKEFVSRDWITTDELTRESLEKLCENKQAIIYKPIDGCCGQQIEKYNLADISIDDLFDTLNDNPDGVIEEVVIQHSKINEVYPHAINTVRVVTIFKDGVCTPVFAAWRIGSDGRNVDNLNAGGMATIIDIQNGKVTQPAADKNGKTYSVHPYTGTPIVGFTIPCWDTVLNTVARAAALVPQVAYVGWDVCVRENDVLLIEGNSYPGHDIYQLPVHTPNRIGLLSRVEKFLK